MEAQDGVLAFYFACSNAVILYGVTGNRHMAVHFGLIFLSILSPLIGFKLDELGVRSHHSQPIHTVLRTDCLWLSVFPF